MRQYWIALLLVGLCGCDEAKVPKVAQAQAQVRDQPKAASDVGRYTVIHSPQVERDTMLDTVTGQTWLLAQFNNLKGEPLAWERMMRLDTPEDYKAMAVTYGAKQKGATP